MLCGVLSFKRRASTLLTTFSLAGLGRSEGSDEHDSQQSSNQFLLPHLTFSLLSMEVFGSIRVAFLARHNFKTCGNDRD